MKILVTGGAGFIGSHLVEYFLHHPGHEVICLDNFDPYYDPQIKKKNIDSFLSNPHFSLINGDIRDIDLLKKILIDVDYVFHEAAQAGVQFSVKDSRKSHDVNAGGTLNLLNAALDSDVKKIINASSSSVFGKVEYLPFDEKHPKEPLSPYGVSKYAAEEYCRVFQDLYGLATISLRYFTVYGPRMRPDLAISIFTRQALAGEPLTIFGDGTKSRDFTNIDDIVRANILAMEQGSGSYNIGGGHYISIKDLAQTIIRISGSSSEIRYADTVKGDAEHTLANYDRAHSDLGWQPLVSLEDGLTRFISWVSNYQ